MKTSQKAFFAASIIFGFGVVESLRADDALVLPQGRFRARIVTAYTTASNQFNSTGDSQNLGASFSKSLDSKLLSAVSPKTAEAIKAFNSVIPGLGDQIAMDLSTNVSTELTSSIFAMEYGLSDRVSIGVLLPLVFGKTEVKAQTSPSQSLSQKIETLPPGNPLRTQLEAVRSNLSVETLNSALTSNFNYADGIKGWEGTGIGDLEIGAKYNWFKSDRVMASLKGGFRAPTGRTDNPDFLFDIPFGDGQWDLGAYQMIDFKLSPRWSSTLELAYVAQLPDSVNTRIPVSAEMPLSPSNSVVSRNLGDIIHAEFEANYTMGQVLTFSGRYRYEASFGDEYSANGQRLPLLEANTSTQSHGAHFQAEYSNLKYVRAGTSRFPYAVGAFYRFPFAGKNIVDSHTAGLSLKSYF